MAPSYFNLFTTDLIQWIENKICQWLDSNRGSLVLVATALPTVPQPLPISIKNVMRVRLSNTFSSFSVLETNLCYWLWLSWQSGRFEKTKIQKTEAWNGPSKNRLLPTQFVTAKFSIQCLALSVTRFGKISPLWQNFKSLWLFFEGLFCIGQII